MNESYNIQNSPNSNINILIGRSFEYKDLTDQLNNLEELFALTPEDNPDKRLQISGKINELKERIEQFKKDILQLAQTFQNIEINTDRLIRAKEFFDKGEFGQSRVVLEVELEQMQDEQTKLLKIKENYESDILPKLRNNSDEYLILAMVTRFDFSNLNRVDDACKYFQNSIKSLMRKDNLIEYLFFLALNQNFLESEELYQKLFNNFASELTPEEVATVYNNQANLYTNNQDFDKALFIYEKSLEIFKALAKDNPQKHLRDIAMILLNQSMLFHFQDKNEDAKILCEQSLEIYRKLNRENDKKYLHEMAVALNNLGSINQQLKYFKDSLKNLEEAFSISTVLFNKGENFYYLGFSGGILSNLAVYYLNQPSEKEREKASTYATASALAIKRVIKFFPEMQEYINRSYAVLEKLGFDLGEIEKEIMKQINLIEQSNT